MLVARLATLTLLKSYAAVLPLELRALDWPTRGELALKYEALSYSSYEALSY